MSTKTRRRGSLPSIIRCVAISCVVGLPLAKGSEQHAYATSSSAARATVMRSLVKPTAYHAHRSVLSAGWSRELSATRSPSPVTFTSGTGYNNGSTPQHVLLGDVSNDGRPDIVTPNSDSSVSALLNVGGGLFGKTPVVSPAGAAVSQIALGDFNGDGKMDAAVVSGANTVSVMPGEGNGKFGPGTVVGSLSNGQVADNVRVADVNGDGKLDIVVGASQTNACYGNGESDTDVLLGNGDGTFQTPNEYPTRDCGNGFSNYGSSDTGLAIADLNGDGRPDIVVTSHSTDTGCDCGRAFVLQNQGGGTFGTPIFVGGANGMPSSTQGVAVGDVNGDGIPDIVVDADPVCCPNNTRGVDVLLGNKDGTFKSAVYLTDPALTDGSSTAGDVTGVAVADLNGDGIPDIVTADSASLSGPGGISVYMSSCGGSVGTPSFFPTSGFTPNGLAVGDVNGDHKPDVVLESSRAVDVNNPANLLVLNNTSKPVGACPVGGPVTSLQTRGGGSPSIPNVNDTYRSCGDPVDCATGNFFESFADLAIAGRGSPLSFTHTYNAQGAASDGPLGYGWTFNNNIFLTQGSGTGAVTIHEEGGSQVTFTLSGGTYSAPPRVVATLLKNADGSFSFTRGARTTFTFSAAGQLNKEQDLNGYVTTLAYTSGQLSAITDPAGRQLTVRSTGSHITSVTDPAGRAVSFAYNDGNGNLTDVTDINGGVTHFTYDANHLLLNWTDPRGITVSNVYDGSARVTSQTLDPSGLNRTTTWSYSGDNSSGAGGTTTVTDPKGNVTVQQYQYGELTSLTNGYGTPSAAIWMYTYDPATLGVTSTADPNGHITQRTYDERGNLLTTTDALNRTSKFTYDALNDPTSTTDPLGLVTTMTYDGRGNLQSVVRNIQAGPTNSPVARLTAQRQGVHLLFRWRMVTTAGIAGFNVFAGTHRLNARQIRVHRAATYQYRALWFGHGPFALQILFVDGHRTTVPTDSAVSTAPMQRRFHFLTRPYAAVLSLSPTTTYQYGDSSHPGDVTGMTDPNGHSWVYTYDGNGDRTSTVDPLGDKGTSTYNSIGWLMTSTSPMGNTPPNNPAAYTTTFTYNSFGQVLTVTDPLGHTTASAYDADGNLTSVSDAKNNVTAFTYDRANEKTAITRPDGTTRGATYNADGTVASQIDGKGDATTYGYDPLARITTVTDPLGDTTRHTYDGTGNKLSTTDPNGNTTRYAYDAANQQISTTRADGTVLGTSYDNDGQTVSQTDGLNHSTTYIYDALNRVTSTTDPLNRPTNYGYDLAGNRTSLTDASGRVTTYGYDAANRTTAISYSDGTTPNVAFTYTPDSHRATMVDGTGTTTYSYDTLDRPISVQNGANQTVAYGYDSVGNLIRIDYPGGMTVTRGYDANNRLSSVQDWLSHTTTFGYDANDNLTTETLPPTTQVVDTFAYDTANRLTGITDSKSGSAFASFTYSRDANSQLTSSSATGVPPPPVETYGYTPLNQLKTVNSNAYGYDAADNITGLASKATLSYDAADQVTGLTQNAATTTFTYNSQGNRTKAVPGTGPATTYAYDQANRLTAYGANATYTYNGDGLRMSKTVSGIPQPSVWDVAQGLPLLLKDGTTSYVYGPAGLPLEQITSAGAVLYFHQDHLGSTRLLTDASGTVVGAFTYDAYGQLTSKTGTVVTPFGYAHQYTDSESGLQYLRARYYDPATAQFITCDPAVAMTIAPYAYVAGNPINGVDPTGLFPDLNPLDWIQAGADTFVQSDAGKLANGWANGVTFGISSRVEGLSDNGRANLAVDQCSGWYQAGNVFGEISAAALYPAAGIKYVGMGVSALGGTEVLADSAAVGRFSTLFGRFNKADESRGALNANNVIRLGWGMDKGQEVFRLAIGSPKKNAAWLLRMIHSHADILK